jgi:hypothetical protein
MFSDTLAFNPFDKNHSAIGTRDQITLRNKFFDSFGGQQIFCYNGDPRKKISSMKHTDHLTTVAIANDSQGADAYFYVNGGRKQYAISRIRACFVDMDAGRDDQGLYFKPSIVMQKKKGFLNQINNFPVKPSWVVDTRNGYQCYWILNQNNINPHKTYWNGIQKKLVNHFGGDARAIKINQIYRIPYTWWRKGWEGKQPYFTSILSGSTGNCVNIEHLKEALDGVSAIVNVVANKTSDEWFKEYAKAYKRSDVTGVPVSVNVATNILNQMKALNPETYTNSTENIKPIYGYASGSVFHETNKLSVASDGSIVDQSWHPIRDAWATLSERMREDRGFAWAVQCNLACPFMDEGGSHESANRAASRIMRAFFNFDIEQLDEWKAFPWYGDPMPVSPATEDDTDALGSLPVDAGGEDLDLDGSQTKLLKTVVEFLNQVSTPLYFSNNRFLSNAAKELASKISDKFCIG